MKNKNRLRALKAWKTIRANKNKASNEKTEKVLKSLRPNPYIFSIQKIKKLNCEIIDGDNKFNRYEDFISLKNKINAIIDLLKLSF